MTSVRLQGALVVRRMENLRVKRIDDAVLLFRGILPDHKIEHFLVLNMDEANNCLSVARAATGTVNACPISPGEGLITSVHDGAKKVIIAHNHPDSVLRPSDSDIMLTHRWIASGRILGIHLIDHILLTESSWMSFSRDVKEDFLFHPL